MLLSSYLEDLSGEILRIYGQIDQKVAALQKATGIKCLSRCGQCCSSRNVKVTPLEFIPLARHLFQQGETNKWWAELKEKEREPCIFFQADLNDSQNGHCKVYPWRAATCRLYGFGIKNTKYGDAEPNNCDLLKNDFLNKIKELGRKNWQTFVQVMILL